MKHLPVGPPSEPFFEAQRKAAESAPSLDELKVKAEAELAAAEKEAAAHAADPVVRESARDVAAGLPKSSPHLEAAVAKVTSQPPASTPAVPAKPPEDTRPLAAYELVARSARLADLVALTTRIVGDAARARASDWVFTSKVSASAGEMKLTREDADTRFGNALDVLGTGGEGEAERALACALWAHAVAESPRKEAADEDRLAGDILWLATHSTFDATPLLDRALGDEAADLWVAIADRVRRIDAGRPGAIGRGEAVVGAAALAASGSAKAKALCESLAKDLKDPVLLRVLATGDHATPEEVRLEGEWLPAPRGLVATTLLAFTGILFALYTARMVARFALAYRRPTEISLSESGVRVKTRIEMLGRVLREREHVILRSGLVRVVREVRFPRAAFYAGLLALAIGSWIGVRTFVDGVRAASPSLLLVGLAVVAVGVGLDFVLGSVLPGARGRVRLAFVPRTGATVCVGDIDARRADDALARSLGRR
ncbi:MAG: hypothetical protein KIT84_24555 [Labilithrix sp.]|nr:hypothetical protein [Labilithrix sp.]MCW5814221.1 hypothetical protein [Labilithrix sp.]